MEIARSYYSTVMSGKLRQAVRWETNRKGGGCLILDYQWNNIGQLVVEVIQKKQLYT